MSALDSVQATLGPDRGAALAAVSDRQWNDVFNAFGTAQEDIRIRSNPPGSNQPRYDPQIKKTTSNTVTAMNYGFGDRGTVGRMLGATLSTLVTDRP